MARESPIRVGLLGAGRIADAHAQALTSLDGVELVGVADVDAKRAHRLVERWHAGTPFDSLDDLLATGRPDVVHVLLPPELHARFAVRCLTAGKHVFVEKPLCVSLAECREIERAASRQHRTVGINHNMTCEPTYLRLLEVVRQRRLGAIQHVAVFWNVPFGLHTYGAPLHASHGPGAVILETGPHPLSLVVRLVGEARSASVLLSAETQSRPDTWQVSLACERGTAQCFIGIGRPFTETRVQVLGEDGCAVADLRLGTLTVSENTRVQPLFSKVTDGLAAARDLAHSAAATFLTRVRRIPRGCATDDGAPVMRASIAQFYDALTHAREPRASLQEGLAVVRSCLRIIDAQPPVPEGVEVEAWEPRRASS
jgi:predicted dehydrogenase